MTIQIVTDSTADIPKDILQELNIHVVPLKVHFGEETYEDGIDLTPANFYDKLESYEFVPTTSQPTPLQFEEVYTSLYEKNKTEIISLHLSSKLSGTFQSAYMAEQTLGEEVPVTVVDTKRASYAIGIIVVEAAILAKSGATKDAIMQRINEMLETTSVYFLVDTLEYLQKNGRIGKASALVGSLLKIKPILSLNKEGEVYPYEKVRGQKKAIQKIIDRLKDEYEGKTLHVGISHAKASDDAAMIMEAVKSQFKVEREVITDIGPVIGTHVGPGTVSVSVTPM
ncbi:DegV family protein [Paenalkalicoccus suaedae]|uniref:DegV family protein n=1 Tax=Paenalkalicoccus suaedae TaxID=2592382 RepID=A0A859FGY9_9BACI|nr:DegV family protein [Paenalkalicoccus suaedae]QKS71475.1 DegV family protein [Paenalkalicoccus suaedae]